jgi:ubiquinone/menaquinone biosynthesis C-methylase UbiE
LSHSPSNGRRYGGADKKAQNLAYPSGSFDACVSTLAIDVVQEPKKFAAEMRRVTRTGGIVACGTFDFWGGFSAAEHINEIGATLDEDMRVIRDYRRARPLFWPTCGGTLV